MYRTASFKHDFDGEWEDGEVAPATRELADRLVTALGDRVVVTMPVDQHEYYGWGFECKGTFFIPTAETRFGFKCISIEKCTHCSVWCLPYCFEHIGCLGTFGDLIIVKWLSRLFENFISSIFKLHFHLLFVKTVEPMHN